MCEIKFGVWTPSISSWDRLVHTWQEIEALGFDSAWVVDHYVNPFHANCPWYECWSLLTGLATQTKHIQIGTLVTNIIYRNPALVAKQAMTVDHISRGRLNLGIGAGSSNDISHLMTGVPKWPVQERVERFREFVEIIDQMLRYEETTYEGKHYQIENSMMLPSPIQEPRPKLTIAAHGAKTLKIAAQYGDSWNSLAGRVASSKDAINVTRERNEKLSEHAISFGRDPDKIVRSLGIGYTPDRPYESLGAFYDFIGRYIDAGINEFVLGYEPTRVDFDLPIEIIDSMDVLEKIATEAIPKIRQW